MKTYIKPETTEIRISGDIVLQALTAIDPDNSGENIYGGETNSGEHQPDAKENKDTWGGWDGEW